ncbi:hypothetical protein HK096_003199 [Nowakowskiella sp. JEL0078]|nr:hypothetical protein HK096_003199 [Nowakowskiella sp. JEL0078]
MDKQTEGTSSRTELQDTESASISPEDSRAAKYEEFTTSLVESLGIENTDKSTENNQLENSGVENNTDNIIKSKERSSFENLGENKINEIASEQTDQLANPCFYHQRNRRTPMKQKSQITWKIRQVIKIFIIS